MLCWLVAWLADSDDTPVIKERPHLQSPCDHTLSNVPQAPPTRKHMQTNREAGRQAGRKAGEGAGGKGKKEVCYKERIGGKRR